MEYSAPVAEIAFALRHVAGLDAAIAQGLYGELTTDLAEAVLDEAGRVAAEVVSPLNRVGDRVGAAFKDGVVTMPPGFRDAYRTWIGGGWNALAGPAEYGGQGLPLLLSAACTEMWAAASMSFGLGPLLTAGGVEALVRHGSAQLRADVLGRLVSGEWTATMNLTEPQAGSDLSALRTRAERADDGTYRLRGEKIYITWGEHDLADNILHLVLARLPDAPAGTRGISLFLVPKVLPGGGRNDLRCTGIERKLGIHAAPTCTMLFEGATGWLVGEENRGLACMFTMMNNARLGIGLQGVGIAERATQQALAFARERRQGRAGAVASSPIIAHPDVQRMVLTMRSLTAAARCVCYITAEALDRAQRAPTREEREAADRRASLLTPVAKAFSTDVGVEVASLGVQVHGGMGFIEEAGAAQHLRDARIAPIYEGTNGIQAIDLVTRKLPLLDGAVVRGQVAAMAAIAEDFAAVDAASARRLRRSVDALDAATTWLLDALAGAERERALAGATPYLRLFGLAQGGAALAKGALAAQAAGERGNDACAAYVALALFFADNLAPASEGLMSSVVSGAENMRRWPSALAT